MSNKLKQNRLNQWRIQGDGGMHPNRRGILATNNALKLAILRSGKKFMGRGHRPLPRPLPPWGGDTPSPHPTLLTAFGHSTTSPIKDFWIRHWTERCCTLM